MYIYIPSHCIPPSDHCFPTPPSTNSAARPLRRLTCGLPSSSAAPKGRPPQRCSRRSTALDFTKQNEETINDINGYKWEIVITEDVKPTNLGVRYTYIYMYIFAFSRMFHYKLSILGTPMTSETSTHTHTHICLVWR